MDFQADSEIDLPELARSIIDRYRDRAIFLQKEIDLLRNELNLCPNCSKPAAIKRTIHDDDTNPDNRKKTLHMRCNHCKHRFKKRAG